MYLYKQPITHHPNHQSTTRMVLSRSFSLSIPYLGIYHVDTPSLLFTHSLTHFHIVVD